MKNTVKEDKEAVKKECQKDKGKVKAKAAELTTPDQLVPNLKGPNGEKVYLGPKGGKYYINKNGNKIYLK